jgi:hypothetical protein
VRLIRRVPTTKESPHHDGSDLGARTKYPTHTLNPQRKENQQRIDLLRLGSPVLFKISTA